MACPECGSTNIQYRTRVNEDGSEKRIARCADCGKAWYVKPRTSNSVSTENQGRSTARGEARQKSSRRNEVEVPAKKRKTWLWVLGWIFALPIPLTILALRGKKRGIINILKWIGIAIVWFLYIEFMHAVVTTPWPSSTTTPSVSATSVQSHIYNNAEEKDQWNGSHSEVVGKYSVCKVSSADCTTDAITDWYFNYVENSSCNWYMILFTDKQPSSGWYATSGIVEDNVVFDVDQYGDYHMSSTDATNTYFPSNGTLVVKASKLEFTIEPEVAGEYGFENTLNKGTEFEETQIVYHIPAGTYTVTNLGQYPGQIEACSDETHVTSEGWEEPASCTSVTLIQAGESATFTITDGYYLESHVNGALHFEKES